MIKSQEIISFDKTERTFCESTRPEKYDDILKMKKTPFIARGAGLSYCNAGATANGMVIDMRKMNKILAFDSVQETITVEAGMSIGELNNFLISKGFVFPVLPGYPSITIGGCIAFNVHGKSQFKVGTFGDWVKALQLFHPAHGELTCTSSENQELFNLTIGGLGLTGVVLTVKLAFKKLPGACLEAKKIFVKNLNEAVHFMQGNESEYEYVYSWNNLNKRDNSFGEGVVYLEKYASGKLKISPYKDKMALSYHLPSIHNNFTIRAMCSVFYLMEKIKSKTTKQNLIGGSFPIYNKEIYYYLFGKKGFREYQMLIPFINYTAAFEDIRKLISKMNIAVALGSLKLFNGTAHQLSFTGEGVCLTLDVQQSEKALLFFDELDSICIRHRAIINLSKDSRAGHEIVKKLFKDYDSFRDKINAFDPNHIITSDLKKRLNLQK